MMTMNRTVFTGRHAAAILVSFFAVVIVVNVAMARFAISTFGGVVVENSYVASQHFNRWLDEAAASDRLGWSAKAQRRGDDRIAVTLAGAPRAAMLSGEARHPLGRVDSIPLTFSMQGDGSYLSQEQVPAGRWTLRLEARSGKDLWRMEEDFR